MSPHVSYVQSVLAAIDAAAEAALQEVAIDVTAAAKRNVTGGGHSTTMLNVRSGDLRGSIDHDIKRMGMDSKARVGANVVYAPIHEFGGVITDGWGKGVQIRIPARPYLRPAVMDRLPDMEAAFARQLRRRVR